MSRMLALQGADLGLRRLRFREIIVIFSLHLSDIVRIQTHASQAPSAPVELIKGSIVGDLSGVGRIEVAALRGCLLCLL